jgi:hypothetical protein
MVSFKNEMPDDILGCEIKIVYRKGNIFFLISTYFTQ